MTYTIVLSTAEGVVYAVLREILADNVFTIAQGRLDAGRRVAIWPEVCDLTERPDP